MILDIIYSLNDLDNVAQRILQSCQTSTLFTFTGDLGAGKTTLIKSLCSQLGYHGDVNSPTFSIINEYCNESTTIYHIDLYRIKNNHELFEIGFEDYIFSGHYCFVEWPQIAENLWKENLYEIEIETIDKDKRKLRVDKKIIV